MNTDSACSTGNKQPAMSVIIPAHNEAAVMARCLSSLLAGAEPGELEILVVCNGCNDNTAEIARSFGPAVRVLESAIPSKTAALNLGDSNARAFPRVYLDADIVVTIDTLRKTAAVLRMGTYLAAAPPVAWNLSSSNVWVKAFYSIWRLQPYFDTGRLGAGFYAVNEAGHARLGKFPDITADDEFVRRSFSNAERATVHGCSFSVTPPRNLRSLIRIKTRSRRGNMELVQRFPNMSRPCSESRMKFLGRILARPLLWPAVPVYFAVVILTSWHANRTLHRQTKPAWERDLSSRILTNGNSKIEASRG
ncbi:MAG: glycosyltransferase [Planctomycetes bacterium]|nr:glycosyltransferase [Planctomycetota bacterium]